MSPPAASLVRKLGKKEPGKKKPATNLDQLIHERTRLALVSALAVNTKLTFKDMKTLLAISDGNLSAHARKLEDAGYITCSKRFDGRVPRTEYSLTEQGREALQKYVAHMEALFTAMKKG
ncbi:MAG: transcriptional regulator [Pseudomonadales bacterium]|nr:transcriptional regulator [Pseudomonadales bacterium]